MDHTSTVCHMGGSCCRRLSNILVLSQDGALFMQTSHLICQLLGMLCLLSMLLLEAVLLLIQTGGGLLQASLCCLLTL